MSTAYEDAMAELKELQGSNAIIYGMPRITEVPEFPSRRQSATLREKVVTWAAGLILIDLIFAAGIRAIDLYMKWRR